MAKSEGEVKILTYSQLLKKFVPSAIILVLLFIVAEKFFGDEWTTHLRNIDPSIILVLVLFSILNYSLRIIRWHYLFRATGIEINKASIFISYVIGFSMAATPGKIGEVLRLWFLRRTHNIPYSRSIVPLVGDRVTDLIAICGLSIVGMAALKGMYVPLIGALIITVILTCLWLFPRPAIKLIDRLIRSSGMRTLFLLKCRRFLRRISTPVERKFIPLIIGLSFLAWLMEGVGFWVLLDHLGRDLPITIAVSIFCVSILVGALSMLPGGLGGAEITMVVLLVATGVPDSLAIAATAVIRATTLWLAIFIGLGFLPISLRYNRQKITITDKAE